MLDIGLYACERISSTAYSNFHCAEVRFLLEMPRMLTHNDRDIPTRRALPLAGQYTGSVAVGRSAGCKARRQPNNPPNPRTEGSRPTGRERESEEERDKFCGFNAGEHWAKTFVSRNDLCAVGSSMKKRAMTT